MVYPVTRKTLFPILRSFINRISGLENLPKKGPYIIVGKHVSALDGYLLAAALIPYLNQKIHFIANTRKWGWLWEKVVAQGWGGSIPFDTTNRSRCLSLAAKLLEDRKIVGIFPEGYLREYGRREYQARTGIARLAIATRTPIVPVGLKYDITVKNDLPVLYQYGKSIKNIIINKDSLELNIGRPFNLEMYYNKEVTKELLRKATDEVMSKIEDLSEVKNINIIKD